MLRGCREAGFRYSFAVDVTHHLPRDKMEAGPRLHSAPNFLHDHAVDVVLYRRRCLDDTVV